MLSEVVEDLNDEEKIRFLRRSRIRIIVVCLFLIAGAGRIAARSWEITVKKHDYYLKKATEQQLHRVRLPPTRGPVVDRNGDSMAISVMVPSVYVNPSEIRSYDEATALAGKIAEILSVDREVLLRKLLGRGHFIWIKRRISPSQAADVKKLNHKAIKITYESKRFYPHGRVASHVLGFGGYDAVGLEGIELKFNAELIGNRPVMVGYRDARGKMVFTEGLDDDVIGGGNKVILSIDKTIQTIVEEELGEFVRLFEAKAGSVVVINPRTGEILAMANYPDFDPNFYWKYSPDVRRNRAVTDRFEPGSVMKVFTMAAALDAKAVKLTDLFYCHNGRFAVDDLVIRDSHRDEFLRPVQIIQRSSNIGITKIAFQTGRRNLYNMLRRFGFGSRTGVEFPGETAGLLRHWRRWYDVDFASIAFGYGVGVSLIQLAMATGAIANDGKLLKPILVKKVVSAKGRTMREFRPKVVRKVVDRRVSGILAKMMVSVTQEGGTGMEAKIPGFSVSGKTGTAQKPDTVSGGYAKDRWVASFIGFIPTENAKIAMAIMIDEPLINYYGGIVAAPLFRRAGEKILRYLGAVPKLSGSNDMKALETRMEKSESKGKTTGVSKQLESVVEGSDDDAAAQRGNSFVENERVSTTVVRQASCAGDCVVVPSFEGMGMVEALSRAVSEGIRLKVVGSGKMVSQRPLAGSVIRRDEEIEVIFASER